jgi:hypothetical protein
MAVSTVSTVNMYLLNSGTQAPPAPTADNTVKQTNVVFPTAYTGLATQIGALPTYNDTNVSFNYTQGAGATVYANGDYSIITGGYAEYPAGTDCTGKACFDNSFGTHWGSTYVGFVVNRNGVASTPAPTQNPYVLSGSIYNYQGGGVANYHFTTSYTGGTVSGDWVQVNLPYKFCIKSLSMSRRLGNTRTPRFMTIVGSNDAVTWTLIASNLSYPSATADNVWYTANVTNPTKRFSILRFVVTQSNFAQVNMSLQFTGDTYDITADTQ